MNNNNFSTKNNLIYKMKCLNCRDSEYIEKEKNDFNRTQNYNNIIKK